MDNVGKPNLSPVWVFLTDGLFVVLLWMMSEWFSKYNHNLLAGVALWFAIEAALLGLGYGAYKIWPLFKSICVVFIVLSIGLLVVPLLKFQSKEIWQPPELPKNCKTIHLIFGETETGSYAEAKIPSGQFTNGPFSPFQIGMMDIVKLYIKNNRLYVQTRLPSKWARPEETFINTNQISFLTDFESDSEFPATWDRNFNANAFEIVDEKQLPLLQVFYKRGDTIVINGMFAGPNGIVSTFEKVIVMAYSSGPPPKDFKIPSRKALFKYPGRLHRGELAN